MKIVAKPWEPQDLLDDLQEIIDEESDNYLNTRRTTLETALAYLKEYFAKDINVPGWIPVTVRLPEDDLPKGSKVKQIKVLTALKSDKGVRTVRSQMRYRCTWYSDSEPWTWKYSGSEITHWMPLPEPPKESDNGK